jgi:hypothetical protein
MLLKGDTQTKVNGHVDRPVRKCAFEVVHNLTLRLFNLLFISALRTGSRHGVI